jgi:hypothetical protein
MSLASGDLTTLAVAKAYMSNPPPDPVLSGLITRISAQIRSALNRNLLVPTSYVQQFSGQWTRQLVLPEWPLITLSSLTVDGVAISIAPQMDGNNPLTAPYGYRFQPWNGVPPGSPAVLDLIGTSFYGGLQNVVAAYSAGYQVADETQTIPATPYTVSPKIPFGSWATDQGVIDVATGVAMTAIASGTPAMGEYLPPDPTASTPRLTYLFAAADTGQQVSLTYGFIPADLEQACIELISERASYRSRIGIRSQSLAGQETIAYDLGGITRYVKDVLGDYVSVLPPAIGAPV